MPPAWKPSPARSSEPRPGSRRPNRVRSDSYAAIGASSRGATAALLVVCVGCAPVPILLEPPAAASTSLRGVGPPPPISASTSTVAFDGDVVLQAPRNNHHALLLVRDYFRAIGTESLPAMIRLLTPKAKIRTSAGGRPGALIQHWQSRFQKLDYRALAGNETAQLSRLELYRS